MARKMDTVLHGGAVVLGAGAQQQDVAIIGEKIVAIGAAESMRDADRVIDITQSYVLPGVAVRCPFRALAAVRFGRPMPGGLRFDAIDSSWVYSDNRRWYV